MTDNCTMPDFVKNASESELTGDMFTDKGLFADPARKRWPFHTKAAVWQSATELAALPDVKHVYVDRIKTAAKVYGIAAEIDDILTPKTVATAPASNYGLVINQTDGSQMSLFPLRHNAEIQKAAEYLNEHLDAFQFAERQTMANNIIKAAEKHDMSFDADTQHFLEKTAGLGEYSTKGLNDAINTRIKHLPAAYQKLSAFVTERRLSYDLRHKIASMLDMLDRETGLTKLYGSVIERPEETLFGITKAAMTRLDSNYVYLTNGAVFEKSALANVPVETITEWFGDDAQDLQDFSGVDVDSFAKYAAALNEPTAEQFVRIVAKHNIQPVTTLDS